jgi:endonuclease III related protein
MGTPKVEVSRRLRELYRVLLRAYGPQGWWPIPGGARRRGFDRDGYHRGNFAQPRAAVDRFEVIMGAVLTQNTAWTNAAAALARLREAGVRLPADIQSLAHGRLARLVRSSGYFNQKAKKLKVIAGIFAARGALTPSGAPSREALLGGWGVGPETADSILLYAFHRPVFVVDAYTRRILSRIGLIDGREPYDQVQALFHDSLEQSPPHFNEYHALIVEHAKRHCRTRPECGSCPVKRCLHGDSHRA